MPLQDRLEHGRVWKTGMHIHYHRTQCGHPRGYLESSLLSKVYNSVFSTKSGDDRFIQE